MVKLLLVLDKFSTPYAGTESQVLKLLKNINKKEFDVCMLVLNHSEWLEENKNQFPVEVDVLGRCKVSSMYTWYKLYKYAKAFKLRGGDIVHTFFNDSSVLVPPVFKVLGMKVVISRRDMGFWYNKRYRAILPITQCFCDSVAVNSTAVGKVTIQVEKVPMGRVSVIHNGYTESSNVTRLPSDLQSFKGQSKLLVIVANLKPIKRIEDAIKALSILIQKGEDVKLVVIGAGEQTSLRKLATDLQCLDYVFFAGQRDDVENCLQLADIGLLCSESEGLSNSLVEYQWYGLPTVCSNVGGNSEVVLKSKTGMLYPVGDIKAMVKHILDLINNNEKRTLMSNIARQSARLRFSVETMALAYEQLYLRLINK